MSDPQPSSGEGKWLPDEARLIALVSESGLDDWAAGVATGLAELVGAERGRTFLANAAGSKPLDDQLGGHAGAGLTSALTGAASLASVARRPLGQRFAYFPAGDAALPFSALRRMEPFRKFLRRAREGGGTVLLYLGEADLLSREKRKPGTDVTLDGCIALGGVQGVADALGAPLLARVERPVDPAEAAAAPAAVSTDAPKSASGEGSGEAAGSERASGVGAGAGSLTRLLIPLGLLALVWATAVVIDQREGSPPRAAATPSSEELSEGVAEVGIEPAGSDSAARGPVSFSAPPASYSILVGSYVRLSDALERRTQLASDGGLFFVSPTPVRGRVYQRVLAGVYEDRSDALEGMRELVDEGRKEVFKEWDVRPVRLAFDLGTFRTRAEAEDVARVSTEQGMPAYVLRDTAGVPRYRVYVGAFERESAAGPTLEALATDSASLVPRTGLAP